MNKIKKIIKVIGFLLAISVGSYFAAIIGIYFQFGYLDFNLDGWVPVQSGAPIKSLNYLKQNFNINDKIEIYQYGLKLKREFAYIGKRIDGEGYIIELSRGVPNMPDSVVLAILSHEIGHLITGQLELDSANRAALSDSVAEFQADSVAISVVGEKMLWRTFRDYLIFPDSMLMNRKRTYKILN